MYTGPVVTGTNNWVGIVRRSRCFGAVLAAALPALLFMSALLYPPSAAAAVHPGLLRHPSCLCGADFNRDGLSDQASISFRKDAAFIQLSLSGESHPLRLRAGKGVLNVVAFDIDRDGDADIVALTTNLRLRIWLNNGQGQFVRRNGPEKTIAPSRERLTRDPGSSGAFCGSSPNDDAGLLGRAGPVTARPEPSQAGACEPAQRPAKDASLASIHPRAPPLFLA